MNNKEDFWEIQERVIRRYINLIMEICSSSTVDYYYHYSIQLRIIPIPIARVGALYRCRSMRPFKLKGPRFFKKINYFV